MSSVTFSKASKEKFEELNSKVESGPGDKPLYFKNNGLFSENYLMHHLSKTKDPFLMRAWETEDLPAFNALYEWMLSTWSENRTQFEKMSEAQLEQEWIRPVLEKLGWEYIVQPDLTRHGKRQVPDYALFEDASLKKKAQKAEGHGVFVVSSAVADAKAMHVDLDGNSQDNSNPSYQIMQYLTYANKDWGILTNGRYWRLYSLKSKTKFRSYFEVNVEKFLSGNTREDSRFKYFFNFFSKNAFAERNAANQTFIDVVFAEGEQYALEVETELKSRAFELVEQLANGFQGSRQAKTPEDLNELYSHSLYYLFRLIFILNCEAKGLLNIGRQSDYYKYSLRNLCAQIKDEKEASQRWSNQPRSYNYIRDLFKLLATGDSNIGVHGLGREMFEGSIKRFYDSYEISDQALNEVLLKLSSQFDKRKKSWNFIDYQRLSVDHMGSIFEGLLEFKLEKAGHSLSLVNTSGERKTTGSYYTPDYVVDHIVEHTLSPVIKDKTNAEILEMKILDPAMGSAHFLLGGLKFLEEAMLTNLNDGDKSLKNVEPSRYKWAVLHNCIYGADLNPLAKELAKFTLWMFSATNKDELEPLDDQLVCTDSLLDQRAWDQVAKKKGFDAIIGNPPYIRIQNLENEGYVSKIKNSYKSAGHGNFDLYIPFVELGLSQLGKNGHLGFILPNKFMTADYGAPLRDLLSTACAVREIVDFRQHQVFADATTYTCLLYLENAKKAAFTYSEVAGIARNKIEIANSSEHSLPISEPTWAFSDSGTEKALKRIKSAPKRLTNYVDKIYVGVQTSGDKIYVLEVVSKSKNSIRVKSKASGSEFDIEAAAVMPLLKGSDIKRYGKPESNQVVIFPYDVVNGKPTGWSLNSFKEKYPKAFKYMSQFKSALADRPNCDKDCWWLYPYPKNLVQYAKPKILIQVLSGSGNFSLDAEGECCFVGGGTAGGNALALREKNDTINLALLGILNSPVTTAYVKSVSSVFRGGYVVFSKATLEDLPIPDLSETKTDRITKFAALVKSRINAKTDSDRNKLDLEINEFVFELYKINLKERGELTSLMQEMVKEEKKAA